MSHAKWGSAENAWPWARTKKPVEKVPESVFVADRKRALRSLEKIQESRPLKPPGKR